MTDKKEDPWKTVAGEREHIQQVTPAEGYVVVDSKKVPYSGWRDILGFYKSLQMGVIAIIGARYPDKKEDIEKLRMQANGFINEAITGKQRLSLAQFVELHDLIMKDIDKQIIDDYTRLMCAAFMFRYVLGKREQGDDFIPPEALGKSFQALYILSILPEDLSQQVQNHLRAFNHVHNVLFYNEPPAVPEVEEDNE
jgi:hypothetical protein